MLSLNDDQRRLKLDAAFWETRAGRIAELAGVAPELEWSLTFVDDEAIRALNRDYRGYDKPTDVLSFSQQEDLDGFVFPEEEAPVLGDVVVSVETAERQAAERGHPVESELTLLVAHGVLHLLGEDHATPEEKARMWARQSAVLAALGVAITDYGDAEGA